jgi:hypothetical protein
MKSFPKKPICSKTFNLKIGLSTGTMTDFLHWEKQPVDLGVCLTVNDRVLYQGPITAGSAKFSFDLLDTEIETVHEFRIKLNQLPARHGNCCPMLKIDHVWIEDLCMHKTLEDSGVCIFYQRPGEVNIPSEYMGEPGEQILKFSTPIYPWLLSNEKCPNYYYKTITQKSQTIV